MVEELGAALAALQPAPLSYKISIELHGDLGKSHMVRQAPFGTPVCTLRGGLRPPEPPAQGCTEYSRDIPF